MNYLHILTVRFDGIIAPDDLPAFRGALAEAIGLEHEWFHNHNNDPKDERRLHYRYPLIQYKRRGNQPLLVAIGPGTQAAQMFFQQLDWDFRLRGEARPMAVDRLCLERYPLGIEAGEAMPYTYRLQDWQPLNQENYRKYQQLQGLREVIDFLQPKLIAHLLNFAKGIGWNVQEHIELEITDMYPSYQRSFKGFAPTLFNFAFRTNLQLPNFIGLGKGASLGFGTIHQQKQRKRTHIHG